MSAAEANRPWRAALVTGASSGIGEAMARDLAAGGVTRLILVARRGDRLTALADELRGAHRTEVEVLVADLTDEGDRAAVAARIEAVEHPVDLVVNNAGSGWPGRFVELTAEQLDTIVELNAVALTHLTHAAARTMVERGTGTILLVSSMTSYQPTPGAAAYAATKAFVTHLGEALHEELRGTGVAVSTLLPGFTRTEFHDLHPDGEYSSAPGFAFLSAEHVASDGLDAAARGRALCIPGLGYRAAAAAVTPLPRTARRWLMGRVAGTATKVARRSAH